MTPPDPVDFVEYQPDWPARFDEAAQLLHAYLPDNALIEHIGSTAVPGLAAKDCIDILVVIPSSASLPRATSEIEAAGFAYLPEMFDDDPGHRFFRRLHQDRRSHHIHLLVAGNRKIERLLAVRDLLRRSPAARARYELVKRELAHLHPDDRDAYSAGKAATVQQLITEALSSGHSSQERGSEPTDTW